MIKKLSMNYYILIGLVSIYQVVLFTGCGNRKADISGSGSPDSNPIRESNHEDLLEGGARGELEIVHLSALKFRSLGIRVDSLPFRALHDLVEANGQLEVPPQDKATVTAILGANVRSIRVIEGDRVRKGQVLASLSHPDLSRLQTDYVKAISRYQYLDQEMSRQKRLYDEQVGSGKLYQETKSEYLAIKAEVRGLAIQLKQLGLNPEKLQEGNIHEFIPVVSPIDGYIEEVLIQIGQYVDPQMEMIRIINPSHIHADLMVFEKDVYKIKEGQNLFFTVESVPGKTLTARIFAVGKQFEQNPKAVHIHAEIEQKENFLIPGMYINGKIQTGGDRVPALPETAIMEEEGRSYIFRAEKYQQGEEIEWRFIPMEVRTGRTEEGWVEIKLLESLPEGTQVAWNQAYYLISEMNKGKTSHRH